MALKAGDATYARLEKELTRDASQRDALTHQMQAILEGTMFGGRRFDTAQADHSLKQSRDLLARVEAQAKATGHS
jgi:hypothetical protein